MELAGALSGEAAQAWNCFSRSRDVQNRSQSGLGTFYGQQRNRSGGEHVVLAVRVGLRD